MATTKKKPAKQRKPEEVWYDVHKHPEGVPGGMGKSPEHHLRNRGWSGHQINEGSGKKTIQYRNPKHPDFVVSYGGGTPQKPDHNFRVLYMGTNPNVPKVTRAYSVAEAMNKVEELHGLHNGLVVQPMIHGAGSLAQQPYISEGLTFVPPTWEDDRRDMTKDDYHPIGEPDTEFPTRPDRESDWAKKQPQLKEIPDPPKVKPPKTPKYAETRGGNEIGVGIDRAFRGPVRSQNEHGTLAGRNRHKTSGEDLCSLCRKADRVYFRDRDLYKELVKDAGGLTEDHMRTTNPFHDRVQEALAPRKLGREPLPDGPTQLGRAEYRRRWKVEQRAKDDADVAMLAKQYGMDIAPEEVPQYRGLRGVVSALQVASQESWEEA